LSTDLVDSTWSPIVSRAFDMAAATPEVHPTFDVRGDVTGDSAYDDGLVQSIFGNLATPVVTLDNSCKKVKIEITICDQDNKTSRHPG